MSGWFMGGRRSAPIGRSGAPISFKSYVAKQNIIHFSRRPFGKSHDKITKIHLRRVSRRGTTPIKMYTFYILYTRTSAILAGANAKQYIRLKCNVSKESGIKTRPQVNMNHRRMSNKN